MKNLRRKAFTLIELMIVLAIIAILAMVLIPKAGGFKGQARNTGVSTNVNTVRAHLENKVGDTSLTTAAQVATSLSGAFTGTDAIKNPFNGNTGITADVNTASQAVYVVTSDITVGASYKGAVIVIYDTTNRTYTVYGVDGDLNKISSMVVK